MTGIEIDGIWFCYNCSCDYCEGDRQCTQCKSEAMPLFEPATKRLF